LFSELVREALAGLGVKVPISEGLLEMKTNLSTLGETWKQQWLAEGEAKGLVRGKVEGRVEGRVEGKAEGKAEALVCLLAQRFGAVAPSWQKRIRRAKLATLERWFKRAIVAPDLPSVFNPPR
jgi:predicted transposase YdaD